MLPPHYLYMQRAAITAVDVVIEAKPCEVCGIVEDSPGNDGLLCDRCDKAYHPKCLNDSKRDEAKYPYWFCDDCLNAVRMGNERDIIYDFNLHRYLMEEE